MRGVMRVAELMQRAHGTALSLYQNLSDDLLHYLIHESSYFSDMESIALTCDNRGNLTAAKIRVLCEAMSLLARGLIALKGRIKHEIRGKIDVQFSTCDRRINCSVSRAHTLCITEHDSSSLAQWSRDFLKQAQKPDLSILSP